MTAAPPSSPQPRTEHRFPVFVAAVIALVLFAVLPSEVQFLPNWLVPSIAGVVLIPLIAINPRRLNNETRWSRWIGIGFALGLTAINQVYVVLLVIELVSGQARGPIVLLTALCVWITNIIAFSLVYWELDRGGPVARRHQAGDPRYQQQPVPIEIRGRFAPYERTVGDRGDQRFRGSTADHRVAPGHLCHRHRGDHQESR